MDAPKLNTPYVMLLGVIVLLGYLFVQEQLTTEVFFILFAVAIVSMYMGGHELQIVSYHRARMIAYDEIVKLQQKGEVPSGTVRLTTEIELKNILLKTSAPKMEPYRWEVGVLVDGTPTKLYVVFISIHGNILGMSEVDMPSLYKVTDTPSIHEIAGEPQFDKKVAESGEKSKKGE